MTEMRRLIKGEDVILQVGNDFIGVDGWAVRWAKMGSDEHYRRTGYPADTFEFAASGHETEDDAIKAAYRHIAAWL